jgi:TMEM175 potassium channel family protein
MAIDNDLTTRPGAEWTVHHERDRGPERLEAFSDAVIAIMLTVLSLQLLEFDTGAFERLGVPRALAQQWPALFAFFLSFLVVGQIWVTHHNMWRYIQRVDQGLLVLNLLLLLSITLLPFCARLLAESLKSSDPQYQKWATGIYAATALAMAVLFNFSLWWAHGRHLFHPRLHPDLYRAVRRRFLFGPAIYLFALLTDLKWPLVSIASYLGVIALYIRPGPGDLPSTKG